MGYERIGFFGSGKEREGDGEEDGSWICCCEVEGGGKLMLLLFYRKQREKERDWV